jgi:hypothetical protein
VGGIDVSIHIIPEEAYIKSADLDLESLSKTKTLNELRVGNRKRGFTPNSNFVYYRECGFSKDRINDYRCEVGL